VVYDKVTTLFSGHLKWNYFAIYFHLFPLGVMSDCRICQHLFKDNDCKTYHEALYYLKCSPTPHLPVFIVILRLQCIIIQSCKSMRRGVPLIQVCSPQVKVVSPYGKVLWHNVVYSEVFQVN
jgi:hypothetical protein